MTERAACEKEREAEREGFQFCVRSGCCQEKIRKKKKKKEEKSLRHQVRKCTKNKKESGCKKKRSGSQGVWDAKWWRKKNKQIKIKNKKEKEGGRVRKCGTRSKKQKQKKEGEKGVGNEMLATEKSKYGGKFRVF